MSYEYYDNYINKKTKGRYDATPIFGNPKVFTNLLDDLAGPFKKDKIDKIAGLEALGFIIGGALAIKLKIGFIPVRKGGKLPGIRGTVIRKSFTDYSKTKKSFEISKSSIKKGERILIVDEWIETGAQVKAAIWLIEKLGGKVAGVSALCSHANKSTRELFDRYNLKAIKIYKE